jgi:hypothetical protein
MALVDLRRLAEGRGPMNAGPSPIDRDTCSNPPFPSVGTPGTRGPVATGPGSICVESGADPEWHGCGTRGTRGTRAFCEGEGDDGSAVIPGIVSSPLDLGSRPDVPCSACGCRIWQRRSVRSGGPGPWRCADCHPLPGVWVDATAIPALVGRGGAT